jgi:hypothetical protein
MKESRSVFRSVSEKALMQSRAPLMPTCMPMSQTSRAAPGTRLSRAEHDRLA